MSPLMQQVTFWLLYGLDHPDLLCIAKVITAMNSKHPLLFNILGMHAKYSLGLDGIHVRNSFTLIVQCYFLLRTDYVDKGKSTVKLYRITL